jgi:hypothetical protein
VSIVVVVILKWERTKEPSFSGKLHGARHFFKDIPQSCYLLLSFEELEVEHNCSTVQQTQQIVKAIFHPTM